MTGAPMTDSEISLSVAPTVVRRWSYAAIWWRCTMRRSGTTGENTTATTSASCHE